MGFFQSEDESVVVKISVLLSEVKGILEAKADDNKRREFITMLARYASLFSFINALFRLRFNDRVLIDFDIFALLLYRKLDSTMSARS